MVNILEEMSTSPNFLNNSLLNPGQSRGVPTPSRPAPSNASEGLMPAAGAHSAKTQLPMTPPVPAKKDKVLQKVIQEYVAKLSDDDRAAFQSAPDIIQCLEEMQRNGKSLISSSLTSRVEKVLQCVKNFMGSLSIFIQQNPEISSLVVGGVNLILTVGPSNTYLLLR